MSTSSSLPLPPPPMPASHHPSRAHKLTAIAPPVMDLLVGKAQDHDTAALPPIAPSFHIKVGNKLIDSRKATRKWAWDAFSSSARNDGQLFSHWVRAGVDYPDYPYARFDVHLDSVLYNDEEYSQFLQDPLWTKSETDKLMDLARIMEMRWAVIHDRWRDTFQARPIEDLMYRYYHVAAALAQVRIQKEASTEVAALTSVTVEPEHTEQHLLETAAARALATCDPLHQPLISNLGTGTANKNAFHLEKERERRAHLNLIWNRTKEEELEEAELRKELILVDAQLRKLKKSGGHLPAARAVSPMPTVAESAAILQKSFAASAPTPVAGTPYLQSARQVPPAPGRGINKNTLKRMDAVLEELNVTGKPLPTKRNCDMYDSVRKDVLTLLSLQKMVMMREGMLQTKRLRLAKMGGGGRIIEEETLLGIAPTAPPAAPAPPLRKSKSTKPTKPAVTTPKGKAAPTPKPAAVVVKPAESEGGKGAKRAPATKRKKKPAEPKPATAAASVAPVAPAAGAPSPAAAAAAITATTTTTPHSAAPPASAVPVVPVAVPVVPTAAADDDSKPSAKKRARKT
jgi:DNA methyltransferase 1-associated protein 1